MATGDLIYSGNHRVFALGQDQQTASTTWWADFWNLTNGSGAKFFLRNEGQDYTGSGPAPSANAFSLNHTYTLAVYEGDVAAVSGAIYQRAFSVTSVANTFAPGATAAEASNLAIVDNVQPGLGEDDPSLINTVRLDVKVPTPAASQYTVVAVLVS